jgi:hypothetical protein
MDVMHTKPQEAPMDNAATHGGRAVGPGSAAITSLVPTRAGISVAAAGSYEAGIGRVDFLLIDLTSDPVANVVDRKDVDYAKPPKQVAETWTSGVALTADLPYRLFVHVYDASGVNLVAYDRRDFVCDSKGE